MNYIADAKTKYFESKVHYEWMRAKWADYVHEHSDELEGAHYMFYAAIRGRDILEGFRNRTNLKKIYGQAYVNPGAVEAYRQLQYWARYSPSQITKPFGDEVSAETARQVVADLPRVREIIVYHGNLSFEEWSNQYLTKQLAEMHEKLAANQSQIEPEFAEAIYANRSDRYWSGKIEQA